MTKAELAAMKKAAKNREAGPGTQKPTTAAAAPEVQAGANASSELRKIKVVALRTGYYQHKRRREGDVFHLVALRTVRRATQEDCDRDKKLTIGMVLKDPKTKKDMPRIMTPMEQFSDKWMEIVDDDRRTSITGLKEGMRKEHDQILLDKYPHLSGQGDDEDEEADASADSGESVDDNVITGDTEVL